MNIQVTGLVKKYGQTKVLDLEQLSIKKGTLVGIIGPNGAGKSTLIKIIGGLEEYNSGEILYDGQPLHENCFKKMTIVFQTPYLLRNTVFQNIAYPLQIRKMGKKEIEKQVGELMEQMDLEKIATRKAWTLSGGEGQKVALARALVLKPELLLLDEPTANIDPASLAVMVEMIKKTNEKGTTILMITHNIQQARRLCTEAVFMHKGNIIEYGETESMIQTPKNLITEQFIRGEILV